MSCKSHKSHEVELALERERITLLQRFMGDVSHDLKTPLTAIRLSVHLLRRAQTEADRERHMQTIEQQSSRLGHLMDVLFQMSRLDKSATNEFTFGLIDINLLLAQVLAAHMPFIEHKGHTVRLLPGNLVTIHGDTNQLDRTFSNLLMNAIHYTPENGIITWRTFMRDQQLYVELEDNGIGIDPADQPHIFERFYRGDKARSTETGGVGLGLTIAEKIVQAHGGSIDFTSQPGAGSVFRVSFPAALNQPHVEEN